MKTWRPLHGDCESCGSDIEVLTDSHKDFCACDGDDVRCVDCRCPGNVSCDADEDGLGIAWHDEPGCECEWCREYSRKETAEAVEEN